MAIKKNNLVEKRNVLNEIRRNNMTLQEMRFFSIYLSKINARDISTRKVSFPLEDFRKIMEIGRMNIHHFQAVTNSLLGKVVNIKDERGGYTGFQLFKRCKVFRDEFDQWYVEIDAHDDALPLMFDFKREYFTYELWNALRLKSSNQLRMYELLKQYESAGERRLPLSELKQLLGFEATDYPRWDNFRTRILESCKEALAENTDICFEYKPIKAGRKITGVHFTIRSNDNYVDQLSLEEFIDQQDMEIEAEFEEIEETPAHEYANSLFEFYAEACGNEFTQEQMEEFLAIMSSRGIFSDSLDHNENQMIRHNFLARAYAALKVADQEGKIERSRYQYFKGIVSRMEH